MSERSAVQRPMLQYAAEIGWERVSREDALVLRGGDTGLYFTAVLRAQLQKLNPGIVDAVRADDIIRELRQLRPSIEGNRDALEWLRGERSVYVPAERRERNVRLIDFEHPVRNVLQVTDEWTQRSAVFRNRADVVFLVNGIPIAVAETKAATKPNAASEGVEQIRRYHRETPELFVASQVFEVTQLLDFYYGATWSASRKDLFKWKTPEGAPRESYEEKIKLFFDPPGFLRLLRDYIVFLTRDDVLSKVILRQHQMRAVEKAVTRALDPDKRRGLVWHTQGSGKTLTMITIAAKLLASASASGQKPLVLMLVDRNELESQLFRNITAYGIGTVRVAESKRDLADALASDYRGLLVSMIHKFEGISANLNTGSHVVVLVDEAHRTTGGDLGNYLMGALPNATYIGFTGTPIDRLSQGKGTFKVFGGDDPRGYLDKYSIAESIEDGTTVRLNYALAPSELRVDRETLEREFLGKAEAEGVADIEELNAILDRAVALKEMMKTPTRVDAIARTVAEHYRQNVEPMGFKAFLVAVDREACALYKEALDMYLPPEYSAVVISSGHNDSALLKRYALLPDQEQQIRKDFARPDRQPRILIVTEKLLTGFDAPILYCMYLDKPMRDHVLLQAIARVNCPYGDADGGTRKPYGFVVDFVGIFERLEEALAFDSDTVASVIENIDVLKQLFARLMTQDARPYLAYAGMRSDKQIERAVEHFADKERRDALFTFVRNLQSLYDVLSPDAFLRPYMDDYLALCELYTLIRNAFNVRDVDRELTAKTRELLRTHSAVANLQLPGEIAELGPQELEALKESTASETVKVLNLSKMLTATVERDGLSQPFLLSIGDRAEALRQAYEDRQLTTQQALAAFDQLAEEVVAADAERQRLGLDPNEFAVYKALKEHIPGEAISAEQAKAVDTIFLRYPDYRWDAHELQQLCAELYRAMRPSSAATSRRRSPRATRC
jgi:type I restriction enzyme R subunit